MKRVYIAVLPLALAVAACASGTIAKSPPANSPSSAAATNSAPAGTVRVVTKNILFNPATIHAKVGQTVEWTNVDDAPHNVTYASGPKFTSSATFDDGGSFTLKLTKPGTIRYFCTIHPGMNGTIVVAP